MMDKIWPYMKFIVSVIGAGVTSALTLTDTADPMFKYLTIASAVLTAIAVYVTPNQSPSKPVENV
jgi:hypothetical protein